MGSSAEAFLDYLRPHWQRLYVAARQYVARPQDVHDLVQEVLLRAWRNFAPTDDRIYHRAWLFVILRNVSLEWKRTSVRRIRIAPSADAELTELAPVDLTEPFSPLPVMDEGRFREFLDDKIAGALDALHEPLREVVVLSVAGGLNYREIGEVLDCPVGTVMSRMARARRMLREKLSDHVLADARRRKEVRP